MTEKNKKVQDTAAFSISPIGFVKRGEDRIMLEMLPNYIQGLQALDGFSHLQVFWWFDKFDDPQSRQTTLFDKMPFEAPPLGIFASRAPMRPNPIALSTVKILSIDHEKGLIIISDIDAYAETPILDLKGYLPSYDRVKIVSVPEWAKDWPAWMPNKGIGLENDKD